MKNIISTAWGSFKDSLISVEPVDLSAVFNDVNKSGIDLVVFAGKHHIDGLMVNRVRYEVFRRTFIRFFDRNARVF